MREFEITNETAYAPDAIPFASTLDRVLEHFQIPTCAISLVLLTDARIHELNRQFLQHDYPTDVLTFPGEDLEPAHLSGEILISVDTAQQNADELGISVAGEILLYFIHGLLHLRGLDDHTDEDSAAMRQMERFFLEGAGFPYCFESEADADES